MWNARSLLGKLSEFKKYILSLNPHIVGVSETWLNTKYDPKFQNYNVIRKDREGQKGGGLLILIRRDIKYTILTLSHHQQGHLEVLAVKIATKEGWGNLLFCYNPAQNLQKAEFEYYFNQIPSPKLIFGDFNARHQLWNPALNRASINISGKSLFEASINLSASLITPPDLPTRINPYTGRTSTLDIGFGSGIFEFPSSVTTGPNLGSDHLPVIIDYNNTHLITISKRIHWNFKKGNWLDYKQDVAQLNENEIDKMNIKDKRQEIILHMKNAGEKHFYLGKGKICLPKSKPWWNDECSRAVALKRRAHNKWRRRPERIFQIEFRRLEARAKKIILKTKIY